MTKACARRPGAAASVKRRRRERRTLLAGAAGELAGAACARRARPSSARTFSGPDVRSTSAGRIVLQPSCHDIHMQLSDTRVVSSPRPFSVPLTREHFENISVLVTQSSSMRWIYTVISAFVSNNV